MRRAEGVMNVEDLKLARPHGGHQRIMTQPIEVVSILVAAGNRRYPRHHHFKHLVADAIRIAPIRHGVRKPPAHTERALLFPQQKQAGGLGTAVKINCDFFCGRQMESQREAAYRRSWRLWR
jgi:hypothetical protein